MMKKLLCLALIGSAFATCQEPLKVTGNPADHTATSGTVGSAKMTTQMPGTPKDTLIRPQDTLRLKKRNVP